MGQPLKYGVCDFDFCWKKMEKEEIKKKPKEIIQDLFQVLSHIHWLISVILSSLLSPIITVKVVIIMPDINPWIILLLLWLILFLAIAAFIAIFKRAIAENKSKEQEEATKEKQQIGNIQSEIAKTKNTINRVEPITPQHIEKCDRWMDDDFTPIAIRERLPDHKRNVQEYNKWLDESKSVFACETKLIHQRERVKELNQQFIRFKKGDLQGAVTSRVMIYVLGGTINVEQCKEDLLQNYNRDCKTEDGTDTLIGFCDSERFHEFVDALKEIQERPSLEAFREAKRGTLGIVEEIERALKE